MANHKTDSYEVARLVSMANDIAANLGLHADADKRIAEHINRFWTPRMRKLLLEYAAKEGQGLCEAMLPVMDKLNVSSVHE